MKGKIFALMGGVLVLAACQSTPSNEYANEIVSECVGANCAVVHYASPNGNDLLLETDRHIIHITAETSIPYKYYVWAGEKTTEEAPDMVVQDGEAIILVEE